MIAYAGLDTRMELRPYKNLIPDSPLHRHLEHLLRESGGRVAVATVCEEVLQLRATEPALAETLVATLIENDFRMRVDGGGVVEWVEPRAEEVWRGSRRFVVVDLETTNGSRDEQRIIELGISVVEGGKVVGEWASLVNPGRPIPYWVWQMTGISDEDVRGAPPLTEVLPRLLAELEEAIVVAHHARFDVACLNSELSRLLSKRLGNRYLCTVELARRLLPGSRNYRLETLSRSLRLTHERPHRAGSDARATAELFCRLLVSAGVAWSDYLRPRDPSPSVGTAEKIVETKAPPVS